MTTQRTPTHPDQREPPTLGALRASLAKVATLLDSGDADQAKRVVSTAIDQLAEMEGWILQPRRGQYVCVTATEGWCNDPNGVLRPLSEDVDGFFVSTDDDGYHNVDTKSGKVIAYAVRQPKAWSP